jgi:hypothetical protein
MAAIRPDQATTPGACAPCAASPHGCARTPPFPHHRQRQPPRRSPDGSSPRRATSPTPTTPSWRRSPHAAPNLRPPRPWSASSPRCSATGTANTCPPGPPGPRPARSAARIRQRTPQGLGRGHRRAHPALQLRHRRRPRQPHQDDQTPDVRTSETRPAPQARPARQLKPSPQLGQSHLNLAVDTLAAPAPSVTCSGAEHAETHVPISLSDDRLCHQPILQKMRARCTGDAAIMDGSRDTATRSTQ